MTVEVNIGFSMNLPSPADLIETFDLLPDWEARYAYLIDLGRALPDMDESLKTDAVRVPGCTSRVWLVAEKGACHPGQAAPKRSEGGREPGPSSNLCSAEGPGSPLRVARDDTSCFHFHISSDAAIVKGLCAVLMVFVEGRTAQDIRALDLRAVFEKLHLSGNLSPNRRNGFFALVARINHLIA